jgi:hypothetical protein
VLAKRVKLLREQLDQVRAGSSRIAAESMLETLILSECDAKGNFTELPRGTRSEVAQPTKDERTMTSTSADHHRLYRFSRFQYPEYWAYVIEAPEQPQTALFSGATPLNDAARNELIRRVEQALAAIDEGR